MGPQATDAFQAGELALAQLHAEMRACRRCLEHGHSVVPGAIFSGPLCAQIVLVGQAPGVSEVEAQRPFHASAGRRLFEWLSEAGWEEDAFRATQYMTAMTKCYPGKAAGGRGDRAPSRSEQQLCGPFLARELELVEPSLIIAVGALAVRRFLGQVKLREVVGQVYRREKRWVVPLPHPSGANLWLNRAENQALVRRALGHVATYSRTLGLLVDDETTELRASDESA
ncbi:MAG: uracil-DNA glycosylase family protein [Anaerolineae bacterium]